MKHARKASVHPKALHTDARGFSLIECMIASLILAAVAASTFMLLNELQQEAGYQAEVQSVLQNTRIAMQTVERYLRQAGNDPESSGLQGITIISAKEVRVRSDLKGSLAGAQPDKGDPDGDCTDSEENVVLRFNPGSRSIEIVTQTGSVQILCNYISDLSFQYYDAAGEPTTEGSRVRKIGIAISGSSAVPHPKTGRHFGLQLRSEVQILT